MFEVGAGGVSVKGELYLVDDELWARIEAGEPPHLYRGEATLSDSRRVQAVFYPRELAEDGHRDISEHGGWRAYLEQRCGG